MGNKDLAGRFLETAVRFRRGKLLSPALKIPRGEFYLMQQIAAYRAQRPEEPGVRVSVLSARAGMSMPAVSQMLNAMEEKGYAARALAEADRRMVYVALTERGEALRRAAMEDFEKTVNRAIARMGEEKTLQLIGLLDEWNGAMREMEQEDAEAAQGGGPA